MILTSRCLPPRTEDFYFALGIHNIDWGNVGETVLLATLQEMFFGQVAGAFTGGVALDDCAVDFLN